MADSGKVAKGNKPKDFKEDAPDLTLEHAQVKAWRDLIDRAAGQLHLAERIEAAAEGDEYLDGTKVVKKGTKKIYGKYLLPLLEDVFRAGLPEIPEARVEARNQAAEVFEDQARALLSVTMGSDYAGVLSRMRQLQWDDARCGAAFVKTVWEIDFQTDNPADTRDIEQLAFQVEDAEAENAQILAGETVQVKPSDVAYTHLAVHDELDEMVQPGSPEAVGLAQHKAEHEASEAVIMRERPVLKRVPWYRFVYDNDVPWEERTWEAEQASEKVSDMLEWGFQNLNKENLHLEVKEGEAGQLEAELLTAKVWHIRDRRTGEHIVISADGPREGLFLKKKKSRYGSIDIYQRLVMREWKVEDGHGLATIEQAIPLLERLADIDFNIDRHVEEHADHKTVLPQMAGAAKLKAGLKDPNRRFVDADPAIVAGMKEVQSPPIPDSLLIQHQRVYEQLRHLVGADPQDTGTPFPSVITATESAKRGESRAERADDKQGIIGALLGCVGKNFLSLYKKFATQGVLVRIIGPRGAQYKSINPTDIPEELDIYVDVVGETDSGRERRQIQADAYGLHLDKMQAMGTPVNWMRWNTWYGRLKGIRNPAEFVLVETAVAPGQEGGEAPEQPQPEAAPPDSFAPKPETLIGQS